MANRSLTNRQLSRSKLDLFLECPRCFYAEVAENTPRVSGPPFSLNLAVDRLLKSEFDQHRAAGTPHPLFASVGLDAIPFSHVELEKWRANFTGVRWTDPESGWTLFGAVDDVWIAPDERLIVADYKATAKERDVTAADIYPGYRKQLEVYQFLLGRQGFDVDRRGWLVYANGRGNLPKFDDALLFRMTMLPHDGDSSWVLPTFHAAVGLIEGGSRPEAATGCKWCQYVERRSGALARAPSDPIQ
jgi:hypothetical protein